MATMQKHHLGQGAAAALESGGQVLPWTRYRRTSCRGCAGRDLPVVLSLGKMPLANAFLDSPDQFADEPAYDLDLHFCPACSLVQLTEVIHPEALFRNYVYVTGFADTIVEHNRAYAAAVGNQLHLSASDLVLEIASNDGSLLKCFREMGVRTLGVEPALNIAEAARQAGIETVPEFFNSHLAPRLRASYGPAKAVIGNNVLAHVDDTLDFLTGCAHMLDKGGLVITEFPYLRDFIDRLEYDTIYHEHLCYFSVNSLLRLCDAAGLVIVRIDRSRIHGGSIRMYAGRKEEVGGSSPEVLELAREERELGLADLARFRQFAADVGKTRAALLELLEKLRRDGKTVAAYGAPAKGNTLLNYCGIDTRRIAFTVDRNPWKVGKFTPGMHIPVLPVSALLERRPDYVVILAWNFAEEIMAQQQSFRDAGGRFIIPIPVPVIV